MDGKCQTLDSISGAPRDSKGSSPWNQPRKEYTAAQSRVSFGSVSFAGSQVEPASFTQVHVLNQLESQSNDQQPEKSDVEWD